MTKLLSLMENKKILFGLLIISLLPMLSNLISLLMGGRSVLSFIFAFSTVVFITTIPLIILSFTKHNPMIDRSRKIFMITMFSGILVLIGSVFFSLFLFGWGEAGYVLKFTVIFIGPILGVLYLIGIIVAIIGSLRTHSESKSYHNILLVFVIFLIIMIVVAIGVYNSRYFSYKRQFSSYLADIPIYSSNGDCERIDYLVHTNLWGPKTYELVCGYVSTYTLDDTHNKHHTYLTSHNWRFPWDNLGLDYFLENKQTLDYSKSDNNNFPKLHIDYNSYPEVKVIISND